MKTCGNCKFKGKTITVFDGDAYEDVGTGYFNCARVKHDYDYSYKKNQGALVLDGSGYYAALCVEDDFSCIKWESKD